MVSELYTAKQRLAAHATVGFIQEILQVKEQIYKDIFPQEECCRRAGKLYLSG